MSSWGTGRGYHCFYEEALAGLGALRASKNKLYVVFSLKSWVTPDHILSPFRSSQSKLVLGNGLDIM